MKILMTIFSCRNENISIAVAERRRSCRCCRRCPCAWLRLLHGKSEATTTSMEQQRQQQQQLHPQTKRMKSIQVNAFLLCFPLSLSSLCISLSRFISICTTIAIVIIVVAAALLLWLIVAIAAHFSVAATAATSASDCGRWLCHCHRRRRRCRCRWQSRAFPVSGRQDSKTVSWL